MQHLQETNLAWALVDVAKPHMDPRQRRSVFVTIGAGDSFAAIRQMLIVVSAKRVPLQADLVVECTRWLDSYVSHEEEQYLRHLIGCYSAPSAIAPPAPVQIDPVIQVPRRLAMPTPRPRRRRRGPLRSHSRSAISGSRG
jgi:hypothetical protein